MAEGISYIAACELPAVIVDVQRAGPGLGNIWPEQSDYNAVVRGGSHGNYKNIVFAPYSAQEMCDFTYRAFEIADKYRMCVFILSDAYIGQMMEPVELPTEVKHGSRKEWALYGDRESRKNLFSSILMNTAILSTQNWKLAEKYKGIESELIEYEEVHTEDAEFLFVAFGISARISLTAVQRLRKEGKKVGLLRPKTLFPFPSKRLKELCKQVQKIAVVELSNGQMKSDVELAVECRIPVLLYNWMGGEVPSTQNIIDQTKKDL